MQALQKTPPIWIMVLVAGLSQMSETVYTPSLPEIARALQASASMVEYTLTIYLFGMAIGVLFWGKLSDSVGRKPCIIAGLLIFIAGCFGCYFSTTITMLMISRFVQAFGGSIGSVLGQALCRDAFCGPELSKIYATMGSALAVFPAFGPIIGGCIADNFGWVNIFLFLIAFALFVCISVIFYLPETHDVTRRKKVSAIAIGKKMMSDKKVIGLGLIVAASNGILFSYFAEGSFFLIDLLNLSASKYGMSFMFIASATMLGGVVSKKLHAYFNSMIIMNFGLSVVLCSTALFSSIILLTPFIAFSPLTLILTTIGLHMFTVFGICIITSNALACALVDYKDCIGTASSLFGCFYMVGISLSTFGMGMLHNGTLFAMPLYFLAIAIFMKIIYIFIIQEKTYKIIQNK